MMDVESVKCDACSGLWPDVSYQIVTLTESSVYLHKDQFFPGWTVLVFKRHATELFQLTHAERNQLMDEVSRVAQALTQVFSALKVNYALLGNLLPHIHWHVIPRLAQDPAPRESVFSVSHEPLHLNAKDNQERIALIRQAINVNSHS
ncbi:MAG TPA: HIT family protein [Gammaproteobacteria bacterium]|nr:HIT family protein [Gammaproteobacteria bacterium]